MAVVTSWRDLVWTWFGSTSFRLCRLNPDMAEPTASERLPPLGGRSSHYLDQRPARLDDLFGGKIVPVDPKTNRGNGESPECPSRHR